MNKRFMSLLLVLVMVFSLLPTFATAEGATRGVYAVDDDSATYTFKVGEETVSTQSIVAGGTLVEPAAPAVTANQAFDGWYVGDTKLDFDANGDLVVDAVDGNVTVQARIVNVWRVTFKDESDANVVSVKSVKQGEALDLSEVKYDVTSTDGNRSVVGWTETKGSTTMVSDPYVPAADKTLYPVIKTGNWLKFDENDGDASGRAGASYTPSQFLTTGQKPTQPANPTRAGYTFGGWYTNAACTGSQFNFNSTISAETTLFAKWVAGNANYTIIIWKQRITDAVDAGTKTWDYEVSIPKTAAVDSSVSVDNQYQGYKDNSNVKINGKTYDFMGFQFDHCDDAKTVAADGSTILNVYYTRRVITIRFNPGTVRVQTGETDWWGNPKYLTLQSYLPLNGKESDYNKNETWTAEDDGTEYSAWVEYKGLYGAELNFEWPTTVVPSNDNSYYSPVNRGWYYGNISLSFVGNFILPTKTSNSITLYGEETGSSPVRFYKQSVDGNSWDLAREVKMSGINGFTITDKFQGFTAYAYYSNNSESYPAESNWTKVSYNASDEDYGSAETGNNDYLHIFFKRNSYNIDFQYTDGTTAKDTIVKKYQASLSDVSEAAPAYPGFLPAEQYEFVGWFADPELTTYVSFSEISDAKKQQLTDEYGISSFVSYAGQTMPTNNIVLYAGFFPIGYDCALNPNGGEFNKNTQAGVFWTAKNSQIDSVISEHVSRDGYSIAGWEVSTVDGSLINVSRDGADNPNHYRYVGDYSNWTSTGELYEFSQQITAPVYLTAKWLSDTKLAVAYDLAGGTGSITDGNHYFDGADVAVSVTAPTKDGYQFIGWKVEGDEEGLLLPGGTLELNKADQDKDNNNVITLTAVYNQMPNVTLTFDANTEGGSVDPASVRLQKNGAYDLSRVKATCADKILLGWSKEADNTVEFQTNTVVATDCDATLYAVWDQIDNHNYVIDFNGKMTIATSATAKKDDSHNNGAFNVADGLGTYQLKADEKDYTNGANLAFNGIDTALINGVPVGSADGTTASWEKYTVIPANNVYFDDSLVNASMVAGDDNSIKAAVKANEDSPTTAAGNEQGQATLIFTFKGTGIDVYCTTDATAGWIQANVDGTAYPFVNSRYQESEGSTTAIYNTPVISIDGLAPNVEHTLTLRTLTNSNFRLDGIRVYNPMQGVGDEATQATVNKAYDDADESNAVFLEVRDRILAAGVFSNGAADTDVGDITGAVFLETKAEGATIADYTAKGPKEEAYLAPGQAIAFNLGGWTENTYKVMAGLSMPKSTDSGTATVYASGHGTSNPIKVSARTDMFYEITPDASGNVIIKNNGGGMISVTKLKITTIDPNGTAYEVPAQTTGEPAAEGARGLRVTKSLMAYAMAFDPATEVSPTDNVEEPDTPEEPDDPKPGWNDGAFNPMSILKNLFQNLLDGLGKLFGNLPKW